MAQVEMVWQHQGGLADERGRRRRARPRARRARHRVGQVDERRDRDALTFPQMRTLPPLETAGAADCAHGETTDCGRSLDSGDAGSADRLRRRGGGADRDRARGRLTDRRLRRPRHRVRAAHDPARGDVYSFGSSTDLVEQVADGAPGDLLATADRRRSMTPSRRRGGHGDSPASPQHPRPRHTPASTPASRPLWTTSRTRHLRIAICEPTRRPAARSPPAVLDAAASPPSRPRRRGRQEAALAGRAPVRRTPVSIYATDAVRPRRRRRDR